MTLNDIAANAIKERDQLRAELDAARRREAAMREALVIAKKNLHWDALDNDAVLIPIRDALSMTTASDLLTREQVRPLKEALEHSPRKHTCEHVRCPDETLKTECDCWQKERTAALAYAKSLGL